MWSPLAFPIHDMCGIYGKLIFEAGATGEVDERAVDVLAHRGPDERGAWHDGRVFLGMRRLSIIDLAGGHQPIWNEDESFAIVYNGELYNFLDLRPELESRGHRFRTGSDTEVVLHAYEEWGADCLKRFNGMFAFAIWNRRDRTLFIARDRIGEKPLYYYQDNKQLIFASEIKAILEDPDVPRRVSPRGLANFLAFGHAVAPETIYDKIVKLQPGHCLTARDGRVEVRAYWDVGDEAPLAAGLTLSEEETSRRVLELLDDSVRRRMVADVPVGAFLSGGVDSSAIVALMRRHATGAIKTFSLGFQTGGAYNELSEARRVAEALGTEHYELHVGHVDLVRMLRRLVYHYDEPFGDPAGFPVYLLSEFARQHVKVVLTGDGGDELFGGYRRYAADRVAPLYQRLPGFVKDGLVPGLIGRLPRLRRLKRAAETLRISDAARRYAGWLVLFTDEMREEILQPAMLEGARDHDPAWPYPLYHARLNGATAADSINRMLYVDLKTWLADVYMEKVDKASMAASLEARLPMLDHRLVELAFQIPGSMKIRGLSTKRILKRAVRGLIPEEVLKRPKHGFAVPTDPWFRGELKQFTFEVLLDERTRRRGYFNAGAVERLWKEHADGRHVWDAQLWLLLNFELWHRIYLDREPV